MRKEVLDSEEVLKVLTSNDTEALGLSVGQRRVFEEVLKKSKQTGWTEMKSDENSPLKTKSLGKRWRP